MPRWTPPAALAVAAALAAALGGCGEDGERDAVERYVEQANAVQQRFAPRFAEANATYRAFAEGELDRVRADLDLSAAEQSIRDAGRSISRLDPPAIAAPLHRRLLRLYEANAAFASESTRLGRYLPAARAAVRPLAGIGERLRTRLRRADEPPEQSAAFTRYAGGVWGQYGALRRLDPPPVLLPTHRAQLVRLRESGLLAEALADATRKRDAKRVARLLLRFRRVNRQTGDRALMRRAVRDYNARYRDVTATATAVRQEQARLQQRVG